MRGLLLRCLGKESPASASVNQSNMRAATACAHEMEAALHLSADADEDNYRAWARDMAAALNRHSCLRGAVTQPLYRGRVVQAARAGALGALVEQVQNEQALTCGLDLGGIALDAVTTRLTCAYFTAADLCTLSQVSSTTRRVGMCDILWGALVQREFRLEPRKLPLRQAQLTEEAAGSAHEMAQVLTGRGDSYSGEAAVAGHTPHFLAVHGTVWEQASQGGVALPADVAALISAPLTPPSASSDSRSSAAASVVGGSASASRAARDPYAVVRRPEESWRAAYKRLQHERLLAAWQESRKVLVDCRTCGEVCPALVKYQVRALISTKYSLCDGCGKRQVLDDSDLDLLRTAGSIH